MDCTTEKKMCEYLRIDLTFLISHQFIETKFLMLKNFYTILINSNTTKILVYLLMCFPQFYSYLKSTRH